ncbi:glutathione S-transferase C-terminal-like protein [Dichomitus squalens]|uniref:Glutathione S-transferase C-terminal-like protein n=1 Tax=Dichomitus squalens TaxID=114155 RepID=A0A4Q9NG25_9APHY|nr:glutathione S-transferase C-terminal-like protein [Dichomitus squalens]TBU38562.1 glutathione S-transferase C-terminal-like protein [Dichomitus squalens]
MPERITLYTAKICPFAQRTEIALHEAKADFVRYEIDLQNKPEWYAPKVNPASKVPAIAYGGPEAPPDDPSPQSVKLAESLILVEFIGDLFPQASILPADPVKRAQARFFVDVVSNKLVPGYHQYLQGKSSADDLYKVVESLESLLPSEGFAVGEYSLADIAITPFLARARVALSNDLGAYPQGEGPKVLEALTNKQGKFPRFAKYFEDLLARESFKATFDEAYLTERYKARFGNLRNQQ